MTRTAIVLRPAPGDARTIARLTALGIPARALPLFAVHPVAWSLPAGAFDALLITSVNAIRHAELDGVRGLPVVAVGEASAAAARAAGLDVAIVGASDGMTVVAEAREAGFARLLHLAGYDRIGLPGMTAVTVYRSEALDPPPGALEVARGQVALLHSPRAAGRFAALVDRDGVPRASIRLAALSEAVARAAGAGWGETLAATRPDDASLVALAARLAIDP
ncbi:uroporphyrinogen-III synthase [Sphingomonas sp. CL5.1]|uniref:uroporphyrinogen-III synthase n=1 Tax=Sphingomonas sp. CL5.1 TaxID=2653203 RepID=UPI001583A312|nr:uroporphyrinogen-III synthase [Sphingomonas sp. CL5.1]QKR99180.1 uroporphyrinogen-III synthase [Sphingomonas sp. CL5.1]